MRERLIIGSIATLILGLLISLSFHPLGMFLIPLFLIFIVSMALKEYYSIAKIKGYYPSIRLGMVFSGIYIFVLFFFSGRDLANVFPLLAILFGLTAVFTPYFMSKEKPLLNSATTLFGIFYITIPLGCILTLLYFFPPGAFQDGRWWLVYLLAVTFSTNSSALFVGKTFGKTKLAPAISPNKTWEGAIGGFLAAIAVSVLFSLFARNGLIPISLTFAESIFLGTGTSLFAQFGDLAESLLKRDADVKDSSNIPGLGGILDVVDSLVFTAPFIYLYIKFASSWN